MEANIQSPISAPASIMEANIINSPPAEAREPSRFKILLLQVLYHFLRAVAQVALLLQDMIGKQLSSNFTTACASRQPTAAHTQASLMNLPIELVNRVLELVVITSSADEYIRIDGRVAQPAITRTCRLLRHEGLRIFYAKNLFVVRYVSSASSRIHVLKWLHSLFEQEIGHLGSVPTGFEIASATKEDGKITSIQIPLQDGTNKRECIALWDINDGNFCEHLEAADITAYLWTKSDKIVVEKTPSRIFHRLLFVHSRAAVTPDRETWMPLDYATFHMENENLKGNNPPFVQISRDC